MTKVAPTERQFEVLRFIVNFARTNGYPPTLREIGDHIGARSTNTVSDHLRALEKKQWIECTPNMARAIRVLP